MQIAAVFPAIPVLIMVGMAGCSSGSGSSDGQPGKDANQGIDTNNVQPPDWSCNAGEEGYCLNSQHYMYCEDEVWNGKQCSLICSEHGPYYSEGCKYSEEDGVELCHCKKHVECEPDYRACSGNTLSYCDNGSLKTKQCSDASCQSAGLGDSTGCKENSEGKLSCMCKKLCTTADNYCTGNILHSCSNGSMHLKSCTDWSCQESGYGDLIGCKKNSEGIYKCICESSSSCTSSDNYCSGNTFHYCSNGSMTSKTCSDSDCHSEGFGDLIACKKHSEGFYDCICESGCTSSDNYCSGNTLHYCSNGTMKSQQCSDSHCHASGYGDLIDCKKNSNGNYTCLCESSSSCTSSDNYCSGNTLHYCSNGSMKSKTCSDSSCHSSGYGDLIGCKKNSDGIYKCVCESKPDCECELGDTDCVVIDGVDYIKQCLDDCNWNLANCIQVCYFEDNAVYTGDCSWEPTMWQDVCHCQK